MKNICLVDDDQMLRELIVELLEIEGFNVTALNNGVECLEYLEHTAPDLLILDVMMPKLDGLKVLKALRDIEKQKGIEPKDGAKIIMTTALNDKNTIMNAYDNGCEAYAWKPIETEKFTIVMQKLGLIE